MNTHAIIEEAELRLFARLAAPQLNGISARGSDPRASRDIPGSGLEFLDLRAYQPGDDIRHIDWRQTARRGEAVVRRFRNEAASDWFICVDCSASVGMHPSKWLMSIRLASALAYTCLFSGHRVAMLLFSDRIQGMCHLGRGAHQFAALLDLLLAKDADALAANTGNSGFGRTRQAATSTRRSNLGLCRDYISRNSNIFIISDFLEADGMRSSMQSIRSAAASASAIQVLADDEIDVPVSGVTQLVDVESGESRQVAMSEEGIAKTMRALDEHGINLRKDCSRLGVRFTACQSSDAWQQVLIEHLRVRQ
jgi:uncharacterized protein (DUF58 family)